MVAVTAPDIKGIYGSLSPVYPYNYRTPKCYPQSEYPSNQMKIRSCGEINLAEQATEVQGQE